MAEPDSDISSLTSPLLQFQQVAHPSVQSHESPTTTTTNWWKQPRQRYTCCNYCNGISLTRRAFYTINTLIILSVLLILSLIIVFAVLPSIMKRAVNESSIEMHRIRITDPQLNSLQLSADIEIHSAQQSAAFSATIEEMTVKVSHVVNATGDRKLYDIGTTTMPAVNIDNSNTYLHLSHSVLSISNTTHFAAFVREFVSADSVVWHISAVARVTAYMGKIALPSHDVAFEKDVALIGCSSFPNTSLHSLDFSHSSDEWLSIAASSAIVNPSEISMDPVGDLHFHIVYNGLTLGDVFSKNASLLGGINWLPLTGALHIDSWAKGVAASELIKRYLSGESTAISAVAAEDVSSIPLFNQGLQGLILNTTFPGRSQSLVESLQFQRLELNPSSVNQTVGMRGEVSVKIASPLGPNAHLYLSKISLATQIKHTNRVVGTLNMAEAPVREVGAALYQLSFDSQLIIEDYDAYATFVNDFMQQSTVEVELDGVSSAQARYKPIGELNAHDLPINTISTLQGLSGLQHTLQRSFVIDGAAECSFQQSAPCGVNIELTASLFNPSLVSVQFNDAHIQVSYDNHHLATVSSDEFALLPGENVLSARGVLLPSTDAADSVGRFISHYVSGVSDVVQLSGIVVDKQSNAQALTLSQLSISASTSPQQIQLLHSINLQAFSLDFGMTSSFSIVESVPALWASGQIDVELTLPPELDLPLNVTRSDLSFNMTLTNETIGKQGVIGQLNARDASVQHKHGTRPGADVLTVLLPETMFIVRDKDAFSAFAERLLLTSTATTRIVGIASPSCESAIGDLQLHDLPAISDIQLRGFNAMIDPMTNEPLLHIVTLDVVNASEHMLSLRTVVNITSPSQVSLTGVGAVRMDLYAEALRLGFVTIDDFTLKQGDNQLIASGVMIQPQDGNGLAVLSRLLSNFINQQPSIILLSGNIQNEDGSVESGTKVELLKVAFSKFQLQSQLPGLSSAFITQFGLQLNFGDYMRILFGKAQDRYINCRANINNPFSVDMKLLNANLSIFISNASGEEQTIGQYEADLSSDPLLIPAHTNQPTRFLQMPLSNGLSSSVLSTFLDLVFKKSTLISCRGRVKAQIGADVGMIQDVDVEAKNVETAIV